MMFRIVDGAAAEEKEERDEGSTQQKEPCCLGWLWLLCLFVLPLLSPVLSFRLGPGYAFLGQSLLPHPFNLVLLTQIVLLTLILPLRIKRSTTGWRKMHENDGYTECECFHLHFQGL
jgi:hypothetical protein